MFWDAVLIVLEVGAIRRKISIGRKKITSQTVAQISLVGIRNARSHFKLDERFPFFNFVEKRSIEKNY